MTTTYKYIGGGYQFISGVPTRDLTEEEYKALSEEQKTECLASGLYVPEKKKVEAQNG